MAPGRILKEIVIISVIAIGLGVAVNALSPHGIALKGDWDKSKGMITARSKNDIVGKKSEIELADAIALYQQGVLFVDARAEDFYKTGHIKGAISLPVENFFDKIAAFQKQYPETTAVITYCSGRECSDSHDLAENLTQAGYANVRIFIDGYPAWESQGQPVEK